MSRLASCKYCGRIHEKSFDCGKKPKRKKLNTQADKFRWSQVWKDKRDQIKERDRFMCQICIRGLYNTDRRYVFNNLEVHHIIPLAEDFKCRLDDDKLITICEMHHEMAEKNNIPRAELLKIAQEQEVQCR